MRKIPFAGIELTSQRVRGYMVPLSYRGDRFDRSPPVGHLYFHFLVFSEKNPVCRDRTHVPTCQRLHGTSELPGTGSPMEITLLGQQYNVGERPTVVLLLLLLIHTLVCVCVFFPSILDIKFVGRTSRGHTGGRSHRISNPPSFCGACLDFCREKDSAIPFPRRP